MPSLRHLAIVSLLSLARVTAQADIHLPGAPPPQAEGRSARVLRGGATTIELRGHHGGSGAVLFWIVRSPAHGQLSKPRDLGDNRASVTYLHDGSGSSKTDGFSYLVQGGGRVSVAAEVRLTIDEPPARLRLSDALDFGEVMAGQNATRPLVLANEGGGLLEGRLSVSSPWVLPTREYHLAAGQASSLPIAFWPNEARDFVGQITVTGAHGEQRTVGLRGSATAPITLAPNPVLLGPLETAQRATVFLTNRTDRTLGLDFQANLQFAPIAPVILEPKAELSITVEVRPDIHGPLRGTIAVRGPGFTLPLRVEATGAQPASPSAMARPTVPARSSIPIPTSRPGMKAIVISPPPVPPAAALPESVVTATAKHLGAGRWELTWPQAKEAHFRIEERLLSLGGDGELRTDWREMTPATISAGTDRVTARLERVQPAELHMLRVTAVGADGTVLWETPLVALPPKPAPECGRTYLLLFLGCGLAVLLFFRWRGRFRA